jgi:hypothetical protein
VKLPVIGWPAPHLALVAVAADVSPHLMIESLATFKITSCGHGQGRRNVGCPPRGVELSASGSSPEMISHNRSDAIARL